MQGCRWADLGPPGTCVWRSITTTLYSYLVWTGEGLRCEVKDGRMHSNFKQSCDSERWEEEFIDVLQNYLSLLFMFRQVC